MNLSLHYSPCPNDTFIFAGLATGAVDSRDISFNVQLDDVEALNHQAMRREADVIKVSYHVYLSLIDDYVLLDSGSALGEGVGPLLISREIFPPEDLAGKKIAIPGEYTTAHLLLKLFGGTSLDTVPMVFSEVEDAVLSGACDAGVIIHENRFTYQMRGLKKITDLGEYWEKLTGQPIPLGGIIARRSLGEEVLRKLEELIRRSIDWAVENPSKALPYIRKHAQEMDEDVMREHIGLYVTPYTRSLGDKGREAINRLYDVALERGIILGDKRKIFL